MTKDKLTDWRDVCLETAKSLGNQAAAWTPTRWETELRALALLREISEEITVGEQPGDTTVWLTVPRNDPWLALLRD